MKRVTYLAIAALSAFALSSPAPALQKEPTGAELPTAVDALGLELSRVLNPESEMMAAVSGPDYRTLLAQAILSNPNVVQLEADYPGLVDYAVLRMHPPLIEELRARVPDLQQMIGRFFATNLTEQEIREALDFFYSPAGRAFVAGANENLNFDGVVEDLTDDGNTSADTIDRIAANSTMRSIPELSRVQRAEVFRFSASPLGQKMEELSMPQARLVAEWSNRPNPEVEQLMGDIFRQSLADFTASDLDQ